MRCARCRTVCATDPTRWARRASRPHSGSSCRPRSPASRPPFVLGISRAVGETMVVAIAAGQQPNLTIDPTEPAATITAYIVQVALGDLPHGSIGYQTIFAAGFTLMLMTLVFNMFAFWLRAGSGRPMMTEVPPELREAAMLQSAANGQRRRNRRAPRKMIYIVLGDLSLGHSDRHGDAGRAAVRPGGRRASRVSPTISSSTSRPGAPAQPAFSPPGWAPCS